METAGLILAAGASTRMGEAKALLAWGERPLLQHQIDTLLAAGCRPVIVVLGHGAAEVRAQVRCDEPCRVVINADYASGRASSVQTGAAAAPSKIEAVVVANVDQPCAVETVRRLIAARRERAALIAVPRHRGRNGHPAVFAGSLLGEMRGVEERHQGLKAVRAAHAAETLFLDVEDPLVVLDLNRPEDYARARGLA